VLKKGSDHGGKCSTSLYELQMFVNAMAKQWTVLCIRSTENENMRGRELSSRQRKSSATCSVARRLKEPATRRLRGTTGAGGPARRCSDVWRLRGTTSRMAGAGGDAWSRGNSSGVAGSGTRVWQSLESTRDHGLARRPRSPWVASENAGFARCLFYLARYRVCWTRRFAENRQS
jgi:hypothetical protein